MSKQTDSFIIASVLNQYRVLNKITAKNSPFKLNWRTARGMGFPTMWYVRPVKPQISLRIHAAWSEPLLVAWIFYECLATEWTSFGISKLKRRLHRLIWVYAC